MRGLGETPGVLRAAPRKPPPLVSRAESSSNYTRDFTTAEKTAFNTCVAFRGGREIFGQCRTEVLLARQAAGPGPDPELVTRGRPLWAYGVLAAAGAGAYLLLRRR